jgi:hypothetical protein
MAAPIGLRGDFDGSALRRVAKKTREAKQIRRLLALAEIYDGGSRSDAARIGEIRLDGGYRKCHTTIIFHNIPYANLIFRRGSEACRLSLWLKR